MITIKDYETRFPKKNLEYFNNLNDLEKEEYLKLFQKYHTLASKYLIRKFNLIKFDNSLKNSANKFLIVKENDMDLYQFLCKDQLSYFYLRNNFYIERLNEEELEHLKNADINRK